MKTGQIITRQFTMTNAGDTVTIALNKQTHMIRLQPQSDTDIWYTLGTTRDTKAPRAGAWASGDAFFTLRKAPARYVDYGEIVQQPENPWVVIAQSPSAAAVLELQEFM